MEVGLTFATHVTRNSAGTCGHCTPVSPVGIAALWLMIVGSSFDAHISLSSGGAGCHCPPFSRAQSWAV
eukprot:3392517-Pyramimonas_sp.AAC.1